LILLKLSDRFYKHSAKKISGIFDLPGSFLFDPYFPYWEKLDFCLEKAQYFETFKNYLYKTIYWSLFKKVKNDLSDTFTPSQNTHNTISDVEIAEKRNFRVNQETDLDPYFSIIDGKSSIISKIESSIDISDQNLEIFKRIVLEGDEYRLLAREFDITPEEVRNIEKLTWVKIASSPSLKNLFKQKGIDTDRTAGLCPEGVMPALTLINIQGKWKPFPLEKEQKRAIGYVWDIFREKGFELPGSDTIIRDISSKLEHLQEPPPVFVISPPDDKLYRSLFSFAKEKTRFACSALVVKLFSHKTFLLFFASSRIICVSIKAVTSSLVLASIISTC